MINFIIYEDEKKFREKYVSVILKFVGNTKMAYRIIEFDKYDKVMENKLSKLTGKRIYILDIEVPGKSGLDLARKIRNDNDWVSPIIVVTTHEQLRNAAFTSRVLMLDFISKFYNCEENLKETLGLAYGIISNQDAISFQYNGECLQIPYCDILFIEKNVSDLYSTIVTKSDRFQIKKTVANLEEELSKNPSFFRTHRSCIINVNNVTGVVLKDCVIRFGDISTTLLSRDKKKELKDRIGRKLYRFGEGIE